MRWSVAILLLSACATTQGRPDAATGVERLTIVAKGIE